MDHVVTFGVAYYWDSSATPAFVQTCIRIIVGKYGNDLDAAAPAWARLKAYQYLSRFGTFS